MTSAAVNSAAKSSSAPGSTVVVANGSASALAPDGAREKFAELIASQLGGASVLFTECADDIVVHARSAVDGGASRIVACGGDGTISAIAAALTGTDVVLGVIPHGTFNHFARDLGIPLETDKAIEVLRHGRILSIDAAEVNGHWFINNAGLGLYPDAVAFREHLQRVGWPKSLAAVAAALRSLIRYRLIAIRVIVNREVLHRFTPVVFVGNNEYVVEKPLEPKRMSLADGELCLYIPHPRGRLKLVWFTIGALFKRIQPERDVDIVRTKSFTIESPRSLLRVSMDGEVVMLKPPLEFTAHPGALRVVVPGQTDDRSPR